MQHSPPSSRRSTLAVFCLVSALAVQAGCSKGAGTADTGATTPSSATTPNAQVVDQYVQPQDAEMTAEQMHQQMSAAAMHDQMSNHDDAAAHTSADPAVQSPAPPPSADPAGAGQTPRMGPGAMASGRRMGPPGAASGMPAGAAANGSTDPAQAPDPAMPTQDDPPMGGMGHM